MSFGRRAYSLPSVYFNSCRQTGKTGNDILVSLGRSNKTGRAAEVAGSTARRRPPPKVSSGAVPRPQGKLHQNRLHSRMLKKGLEAGLGHRVPNRKNRTLVANDLHVQFGTRCPNWAGPTRFSAAC